MRARGGNGNALPKASVSSTGIPRRARGPEAQLILGCARTRLEPVMAQQVREALKEKVDWDRLIREAFHHGTVPLLFWNLTRLDPDAVPSAVLNTLTNAFNAVTHWNLFLAGELIKIFDLFQRNGIRALPLKGPALAAAAYGNVSLRYFGDLDILISRHDILKSKGLLERSGLEPTLKLAASQERKYLESHHDYKFVRPIDGVVVDLQWGVTQWSFRFPLDFDDLWKRREHSSLAGASIVNLPADALLLVLCIHGAKHQWQQLKWICDIAELVEVARDKINWPQILGQARAKGGKRMLLLGLCLAHDLIGAHLPDDIIKTIRKDTSVKVLADKLSSRLFREGPQRRTWDDDGPVFYWKVRERLQDKLAIAWRYLPEYLQLMLTPNKRDQTFIPLPPLCSVGYYLIRPVRLAWERWTGLRHESDRLE